MYICIAVDNHCKLLYVSPRCGSDIDFGNYPVTHNIQNTIEKH